MADAEHTEQPVLLEGPLTSFRQRVPPQPYVPEPELDPYDRDLWMEPADAVAWVREASGDVLSLDAARRELMRAHVEARLTSLLWGRASATRSGAERRGFLRADVLELWPAGSALNVHGAHELIHERCGLHGSAASDWLAEQIEEGTVERLHESPVPGGAEVSPSRREPPPHAERWRFRRDQLLDATNAYRTKFGYPRRTHVPEASPDSWVSHALARGMVARATGYDPEAAAAWLMARSRSRERPLRPAPLLVPCARRAGKEEPSRGLPRDVPEHDRRRAGRREVL